MAASSGEKVTLPTKRLPKDIWMIRPCDFYREEYHDCKSLRGRFNQYYVFGTLEDCNQWKRDLDNCVRFMDTSSPDAAEKVLEHERVRMKTRLAAARGNDVWEYRTSPPPEWNAHLEKWTKQKQNTILGRVSQTGLSPPQTETANSLCVIL
ncbi:UPF0545 protein C22orf39 homolog [Gigantopelta aegis]|uniref:UPF0545 protein C22orf39 homolog n=1 Tax=Gigantopelta aegis TaxID=1735272 RepID=UPI001B8897A8|nr:UPF0545 protein C22orf39 homolog [Gigantopelta aegis]